MPTISKSDREVLALSLRPKTFAECLGQEEITRSIVSRVKASLPRAWLFHGASGGGKTTLARILALSYQIPRERFGSPTPEDWVEYVQYQITELNASELNKVEDISEIAKSARYNPRPGSEYRVIILDEAHRITTHAQNLLLKPFEDGPKSTIWVICTTEAGKILDTLKRRCVKYRMRPLEDEAKLKLLLRAKKALGTDRPVKPFLAYAEKIGLSSPGKLVEAYESYASGISIKAAFDGVAGLEADYLQLCQRFMAGNSKDLFRTIGHPTFEAENGHEFRMVLMGYLRKVICDSTSAMSLPAAETVMKLSAPPPYEGSPFLAWLSAVLRTEIKKYGRR